MTTKQVISRIADAWCIFTHSSPMWPSHGYYRCGVCLRLHAVPWEARRADLLHQIERPIFTQSRGSLTEPLATSCD